MTIEINAYNDNAQLMNDFKAATRAGYGPDIACFVNGPALISLKDGLLPLNDYLDDDLRTKVVGWETCAEGMNADNTIYGMPYCGQSVACLPSSVLPMLMNASCKAAIRSASMISEFLLTEMVSL